MQCFKNSQGKPVVDAMIGTIQKNKDYLAEIDGLIGDGDHGHNMNKGFSMCAGRLAADASLQESLDLLGNVLFAEIGGSMGPIYGTIFMEMADAIAGAEDICAGQFAAMLDAAVNGLEAIIEAKVGDKTIMDTLVPARDRFKAAVEAGTGFADALTVMVEAAEQGKNSTIDLVAKHGRSSRLGERSKGVLDAGATSCFLLLQAMAGAAKSLLSPA